MTINGVEGDIDGYINTNANKRVSKAQQIF
jgi:hypothetical protein